jgi:hypothetical protein
LFVADGIHVGQVLRATGGQLVCDEVLGRDIAGRKVAVYQDRYAVGIDGVEVDAIDMLDYFKTYRRYAKATHCLAVGKVFDRELLERSAELGETLVCSESIWWA